MLGKLIKYDIKSLNRFLIIIHAFLILFAVLIRIFITGKITHDNIDALGDTLVIFLMLAIIFGTILITGICFATAILITVRFYKNLFSDEGYLTHTLPVTSGQHLLAKTISGSIWMAIDFLLICVAIYIAAATPLVKSAFLATQDAMLIDLGCTGAYADITFTQITVISILFALFGNICSVVTYYAAVAIGQFFSSHRVVGAVAAYFGLTTILSVISFAILFIFGMLRIGTNYTEPSSIAYMISTFKISSIIALVTTIILYSITYYILKKKVNLA